MLSLYSRGKSSLYVTTESQHVSMCQRKCLCAHSPLDSIFFFFLLKCFHILCACYNHSHISTRIWSIIAVTFGLNYSHMQHIHCHHLTTGNTIFFFFKGTSFCFRTEVFQHRSIYLKLQYCKIIMKRCSIKLVKLWIYTLHHTIS